MQSTFSIVPYRSIYPEGCHGYSRMNTVQMWLMIKEDHSQPEEACTSCQGRGNYGLPWSNGVVWSKLMEMKVRDIR